jgi:Flp pilus assembly protein TadD
MADLADMLEQYGDKAGALKLYRQALALDPQLSEAVRREKALSKEIEGQGI